MNKLYGKPPAAVKPDPTEDPTKNIQELFEQLDKKFFQSELKKNGVLLEWNETASSTAGYCYELDDSIRKMKRVYIVLNKPLLMLRKREDVVDTLLHEMIHALLNVQGIVEKNGGHGRNFCRIITDEVDHCKDLSDIKKRKEVKKPAAKKILKPVAKPGLPPKPTAKAGLPAKPIAKAFLNPYGAPAPKAHSPFRPGVPSPMQTRRYKTLSEIHRNYANKSPNHTIKLIGYDTDSDSDLSDYDSDTGSESMYDRRVLRWMDYTKNLGDARPLIRSMYGFI